MQKGKISGAACLMLLVSAAAHAEFRQVSYTESIQPQVRVSGASVAGLALVPAGVGKGERAFWAKLPKGFRGDLTVELTTHDHQFQATAKFEGESQGGWEKLSLAPDMSDGKGSKFSEIPLADGKTALRAWIPGTGDSNRDFVLIRWGPAPEPATFAGDKLRVQLNMGTAPEAAAFLRLSNPKSTVAATCAPADKNSRSSIYFQWVCDFADGEASGTVLNAESGAKLIVIRRERDGRESQETLVPKW